MERTEGPIMAGGEEAEDARIDDETGRGHGLRGSGTGSLWLVLP